jgi:hypothetical protein
MTRVLEISRRALILLVILLSACSSVRPRLSPPVATLPAAVKTATIADSTSSATSIPTRESSDIHTLPVTTPATFVVPTLTATSHLPATETWTPTPNATPDLSPTETLTPLPVTQIPAEFWARTDTHPDTPVAILLRPKASSSRFGDIATMHVDGTHLVQLTTYQYNTDPVLAPDHQRIAYRSVPRSITSLTDLKPLLDKGCYNIWVIAVDGTQAWQLTDSEIQRGMPIWSPDSGKVAFVEGADSLLVEIEVDTQTRRQFASGVLAPRYRPDNSGIGYLTSNGGLAWIDIHGDVHTIVPTEALPPNTSVVDFDWLPDGERVVYTLADETDRIENLPIGIKYSTWIAWSDGSDPRKLADDVHDVRVSPDGRMIVALQGSGWYDACLVDQQLVFLWFASDLTSAELIDIEGFEGYPHIGPDQSFYPHSEAGQIESSTVTWVSSRMAFGNFDITCTPDRSAAGRYVIDAANERMAKVVLSDTTVPLTNTSALREPAATPHASSFRITPARVDPGDVITLTWEASGDRATICPSARFALFTPDDCWQASLSGMTTFTIPLEVGGNRSVDFLLTVEAEGSVDPAVWHNSVALKCHTTWFFSDAPQAGTCPLDPIKSYAAAQRFEHGAMIWIEQLGRYVILEEEPLHDGDVRKRVTFVQDPLDVARDTSTDVAAPDGFYAPTSGLGLVWRGDVAGLPGYRETLGWALAPEFGYGATLQCDDALPSGGRSWQTCYLQGPDGETIVLDPLGRWYLWDGWKEG